MISLGDYDTSEVGEFMEEAGWRHVRRVDGSQFFRPVLIGTK
ncbi:MAG: hypothetical protein QGG14_09125 [Planctomycetota bacterium]|nr:hypothetical protein [Planctomycetota bacterium]